MRKSLLTLAVLAGSLACTTASQAVTNSQFFEYPSIIGLEKFHLDLGFYSYSASNVKVADSSDHNLNFYNSGIKLGAKVFFAPDSESTFAFYTTPYVGFGSSKLKSRDVLSYSHNGCYYVGNHHICGADTGYARNITLANSSTTALGLEAGFLSHASDPFFFYAAGDVSKNLTGYKALGLGIKFGLGLQFGLSSTFYADLGFKHFGKADWEDLYNSSVYKYDQFNTRLTGLDGVNAISVSIGFTF